MSLVMSGVAQSMPAVPQPEIMMAPHDSTVDLEALLRENLGALYRYALRLCCGSPDLAEELLLEAVSRFARLSHRPSGGDRALVFGILTDVHRERDGSLVAPTTAVAHVSRGDVQLRELIQVMDQADPEVRAAWWLGSIEGFSNREIAEVLSIPEVTVAARLDRAHGILGMRLYEFAAIACVPAGESCECLQATG